MSRTRQPAIVAVTPAGPPDAAVAIAAARAGALGVLDLTGAADAGVAIAAIERLTAHTSGACGVKLDAGGPVPWRDLLEALPTGAIVVPGAPETAGLVTALRDSGREVWLEATCAEEIADAVTLGASAVIAKGHESGGRIGEETTLVLLQRALDGAGTPVWAHGGLGLHTAAACAAGGAAGLVLDGQLLLARESRLPADTRAAIARMDGSEAVRLGPAGGEAWRVHRGPVAAAGAGDALASSHGDALRRELAGRLGFGPDDVWPVGQDAAFASTMAERFVTVGGIVGAVRAAVGEHAAAARSARPLDVDSPLARSHGTRYPIVQGPMTRVSDRAAFAAEVAEAGALPFLALALMRAPDVEALLQEATRTLAGRPWGVGILGFVPLDLRREQLEVVRRIKPTYALIAGGRPDQALALERDGIPSYLHVPSPALLEQFVDQGARRFVFEGRECGGHVGPRTSLVLWETMIEAVLRAAPEEDLSAFHLLFAGGIHDARTASMVATAAAPLAARGARIGALLGTAYVFTEEAVASGAILPGFQDAAVACSRTVLLETGPGHSTRCAETPFAAAFAAERARLAAEGRPLEERRETLERLNLGRLRIASKGLARRAGDGGLVEVGPDEQRRDGMFMLGQLAALRAETTTLAALHEEVAVAGTERLLASGGAAARVSAESDARPSEVAIVGMSVLLPGAPDLPTYWRNILERVDAITEVPRERWDWEKWFDADPAARDKVYSRWGGFLDDVVFDPTRYGMPPSSLPSIEPLQLLTLEVVRAALEDAGYASRPFARPRTSVILGAGGGIADLGQRYAIRSGLPLALDDPSPEAFERLPEWTEDSFAGILLNVAAGRVANRFDLGGVNYTVDAACASSLAAVQLAVRELEAGTSDMVVVGGCDTVQNPFGYLCFSKTHALSPSGRCRTFDADADGIAISEGIAVLVLKRLADAERDGDRIYAVVQAVSGSSDGRARGLTAPHPQGQALALDRAYAKASFSPATVGLIEAHGTGTVAGDRAEIETLRSVFEQSGAERRRCAVGSVKSMIGHTKCTAGVAGLVKVAMALHEKVLPATLNVGRPNPVADFPTSPFYVNAETRPWIHAAPHPRRAGVSAFGFGGTNFHAVLEEYTGGFLEPATLARDWPAELVVVREPDREAVAAAAGELLSGLEAGAAPPLRDLAFTC